MVLVGSMFERVITRVFLAGLSSAIFCFTIYWPLDYFGLVEELTDAQAFYAFLAWAVLVLIFGFPLARLGAFLTPILVIGIAVVSSIEKFNEIAAMPDLNFDGAFTFRDFFHGLFLVIFEVGERYAAMIFGEITPDNKIVVFFEISASFLNWILKITLTAFTWFMDIGWFVMVRDANPKDWDGNVEPDESE